MFVFEYWKKQEEMQQITEDLLAQKSFVQKNNECVPNSLSCLLGDFMFILV